MLRSESPVEDRPSLRAPEAAAPAAFADQLEQAIIQRIGAARYQLWFPSHTRFVFLGEQVMVGVPNAHYQEWLQQTFGSVIGEAAQAVLGHSVAIRFVIDAALFPAEAAATPEAPPTPPVQQITEEPERTKGGRRPPRDETTLFDGVKTGERRGGKSRDAIGRRRWRTLKDFVVGASNRVAFASAQSVVEDPGMTANPLVLHGPVGTGKTHLLEGIYVGLRKTWPDYRVLLVTGEDFTNRFVQSMRFGKLSGFRKTFRDCAALLLDDLTFLASKRATQEEFLHTFDVLLADGRQIVVSCDCHPRLADELMPELVDRLIGGAVWSLLPPDADTRLAILRAKVGSERPEAGGEATIPIPDKMLRYLAEHLRGNVRELEGALHSIRHYSRVTNRPVDQQLVREALGDLFLHAIKVVRVADVDQAICDALRMPHGSLQSKQRTWAVSHPRMVAIYLARKHTAATYGAISKHFGNKTHSTAVAAEKKVRQWLNGNESLVIGERTWKVRELVERVERELQR